MIKSFEDIAFLSERKRSSGEPKVASLAEMFRGTDIVAWWGGVQRAIVKKISDYRAGEGHSDEIRELESFLSIWTANQLTGSISRGTVKVLHSAASMAAAHTNLDTYSFFSYLRDSLGSLLASAEELPPIPSSTGRMSPKENPPSSFGQPIKTPKETPSAPAPSTPATPPATAA